MRYVNGVVLKGRNELAISATCPVPDDIVETGAIIRPLIWSPCTSDVYLVQTGAESLPYLIGKALGHEMCGEIIRVGKDVHDFKVGDRVIVCSVMPIWRSLEAQDGHAFQKQDNMYGGVDYPDRGGSFVEEYYIRDADMNLALIPDGVTLEQAVMVPDMMCTAFGGVSELNPSFGDSVAVLGIGPVGLMCVRALYLHGASRIYAIGSRKICFSVASSFGATDLVDYHDTSWTDEIIEKNHGLLDGVLIAGGGADALSNALRMTKKGGTVVNLATYFGGRNIEIDPASWGFGYADKTIKGVGCKGGRLQMMRMARLIETGRVSPEMLITHTFHGMNKVIDGLNLFLNHDRSLIKPVIYND